MFRKFEFVRRYAMHTTRSYRVFPQPRFAKQLRPSPLRPFVMRALQRRSPQTQCVTTDDC